MENKKVLCRVDYNVPVEGEEILDDKKIRESIPTLHYILDQGGSIILMSHLGRPIGKDLQCSLRPVAVHLSTILKKKVEFIDELTPENINKIKNGLSNKLFRIVLLENTRFSEGESTNDRDLALQYAQLGDIFVSDAFGTAHRKHASTYGITQFIPGYAGLLIEKEYKTITKVLHNPQNPTIAIVGGAKISSKLGILENLLDRVTQIIIGGAMAFTFIKAKGGLIGSSKYEEDMIEKATSILNKADSLKIAIHLPIDVRVGRNMTTPQLNGNSARVVNANKILDHFMGLDIGPETEEYFIKIIKNAKTIIWNGPMGVFENTLYRSGTLNITRAIFAQDAMTVIGGGDTIYALSLAEIAETPTNIHVSTGGGASLQFISGKSLPGINCLIGKTL